MINMIIYAGFEPILVDLKKNSLETDTKKKIIELKNEIAAVVITHLNGFNDDVLNARKIIDEINSNNEIEKIYLIEDCAVSLGSNKQGIYAGNIGDFAILSFNIMKNVTTLTGGALIKNNNDLNIEEVFLSFKDETNISSIKKSIFVFLLQILNSKVCFPFFFQFIKISHKLNFRFFLKKYRTDFKVFILDEIPSEYLRKLDSKKKDLLLNQIPNIYDNQLSRIQKAKIYFERLSELDSFYFPQNNFDTSNIFIDFPIICKSIDLKRFIWNLSLEKNIDIKNYYYSDCGDEKIYEKYKEKNEIFNSSNIAKNIFMLPVNQKFNRNDIDRIINFLFEAVELFKSKKT